MSQAKRKQDAANLLPNERAVLMFLLQGKSREEICTILSMPKGTLNSCCTRLYKRFGVASMVELLLKQRDGNGLGLAEDCEAGP